MGIKQDIKIEVDKLVAKYGIGKFILLAIMGSVIFVVLLKFAIQIFSILVF